MSPALALLPSLAPFAARLRDLLATIESTALLGAAEVRVRGLGEHLRFACLAIPCDEALVALELEALGRLSVPVVASGDAYRPADCAFLPSGTPFAYLLGGGSGYAAMLGDDDPMVLAIRPCLAKSPQSGVFVPIRLGGEVIGGAALLAHERSLGDRELAMGERLSDVLALTVESFRTERVLLELFARVIPDLLGNDAATGLREAIARHVHSLRITPAYKRRLDLARSIGSVADHGERETALAAGVLAEIERYLAANGGAGADEAHDR
jgi:hypothetical protein